jgi:hypothetical protein
MRIDIIELYYVVEECCKLYEAQQRSRALPSCNQRNRAGQMSVSEMVTIMVYFHLSGYKCFKYFYLQRIVGWHRREFPRLHSYSRNASVDANAFVALCDADSCV